MTAEELKSVDTSALVAELKRRMSEIEQARQELFGSASSSRVVSVTGRGRGRRKGSTMSEEARARISAAQKKRWAKQRKAAK